MRTLGVRARQDGVRAAVPPWCPGHAVGPRPSIRRVPRHGPQASTDRPASDGRHGGTPPLIPLCVSADRDECVATCRGVWTDTCLHIVRDTGWYRRPCALVSPDMTIRMPRDTEWTLSRYSGVCRVICRSIGGDANRYPTRYQSVSPFNTAPMSRHIAQCVATYSACAFATGKRISWQPGRAGEQSSTMGTPRRGVSRRRLQDPPGTRRRIRRDMVGTATGPGQTSTTGFADVYSATFAYATASRENGSGRGCPQARRQGQHPLAAAPRPTSAYRANRVARVAAPGITRPVARRPRPCRSTAPRSGRPSRRWRRSGRR